MSEFEEIESLKKSPEKTEKLKDFYTKKVKIDLWLNNTSTNSIINFKDRTEYKKNNIYHRLNGPAIDFKDDTKNQYYYKGVHYESKAEWTKVTLKELRRIKIKRLNNSNLDDTQPNTK